MPHISLVFREMWDTTALTPTRSAHYQLLRSRSVPPGQYKKRTYQRNPNVTGNMFTVPVPIPLAELVGEFTQT